jgi:TolB-like protein/Flp pilus assembly protein TadD
MSPQKPDRIRFGPFEVDTRSGELLRQGLRINLQDQPFQALLMLLEQPGELVTRDELSKKLWPEDTFVDFERGLNKAINKLRAALRDNADKPRYIETLPQRGYRFVARVEHLVQASDGFRPQHPWQIDSLAVLPLANLSGDPAQEYFSDGLTEELTCAISRIASLRVISRTSAMSFKNSTKSMTEIARDLSVDAVIEGSVSRSGEKVRVIAQLIRARDDKHLWAGRYERDLSDILHLQAEVAQNIATQINKTVDPKRAYPDESRHVNPKAYEACLKAIYLRDKFTPPDLLKSVEFFTRAISLDPVYAKAHGELSMAYFYLGVIGGGPSAEIFPKAKESAAKALELDETTASAHNALAVIHVFYDWDWIAAERESRRAIELSPGEPQGYVHLADYLSIRGRHREAIETYDRVLELDPISRVYICHLGLILHRARRYDESIAQCRRALEIDPHYAHGLWFLALSLEQKGEVAEAIAKLEEAVGLVRAPHFLGMLGRGYALAGDRPRATGILEELRAMSEHRYVSPFDTAVVLAGLGELDAAFPHFEEAFRQRVFRLIELTLPMFDALRTDPRWQDLVRRIGLAQ